MEELDKPKTKVVKKRRSASRVKLPPVPWKIIASRQPTWLGKMGLVAPTDEQPFWVIVVGIVLIKGNRHVSTKDTHDVKGVPRLVTFDGDERYVGTGPVEVSLFRTDGDNAIMAAKHANLDVLIETMAYLDGEDALREYTEFFEKFPHLKPT